MGHTRLGKIPTTRKWREVASLIADGGGGGGGQRLAADEIERISTKTLDTVRAGLDHATNDIGLRYCFYLLTQIVLAARESDWQDRLVPFGIHLADDSTLFDLTVEMQSSVDDYIARAGRPSDVSEMAQQAAGEAISALAESKATTLFGNGLHELQGAIRDLSTKKGFSTLGQTFFGRFMARYLNFYLSRITAAQTGHERVQQLGDLTAFNDALGRHCFQSAAIVRDFCGEWYSKTEFKQGINLENTSGFMAVALDKLRAELGRQGQVT